MPPPHPTLRALAQNNLLDVEVDVETALSAIEHRVQALLLSAIKQGRCTATDEAAHALAVSLLQVKAHHRQLTSLLGTISDRLGGAGIPWMTFKGVAAEAQWFDEVGDRPSADVDILIRRDSQDEIERAIQLLDPDYPHTKLAARLAFEGELQHIELTCEGLPVDLHTDFLKIGVPTLGTEDVWATATTVDLGDTRVPFPSDEWALVGLALHANKDAFAYLGPVHEVARIPKRTNLDWLAVGSIVHREGIAVPVHMSLEVCEVESDGTLRHAELPRVQTWIWERVWQPDVRLQGDVSRGAASRRQPLLTMTLEGRRRARLHELLRQLVPSRDLYAVARGHRPTAAEYMRSLTVGRCVPRP